MVAFDYERLMELYGYGAPPPSHEQLFLRRLKRDCVLDLGAGLTFEQHISMTDAELVGRAISYAWDRFKLELAQLAPAEVGS